jgi:hypothetical protein
MEAHVGYQDPAQVKSPKGAVSHLRVLYDGGEQRDGAGGWEGWSVAELEWFEEPVLACRWNGSIVGEDISAKGYPQASGQPLWFILPKPLQDAIKAQLRDAPNPAQERELTRGVAEASAPAFAGIWNNPEDDVYDAL